MLQNLRQFRKTGFIIPFFLLVTAACGSKAGKPLSEDEKSRIRAEVKEVADQMFKGCEKADLKMTSASFLDSPDFVYLINGDAMSYQDLLRGLEPMFQALSTLKITVISEKYTFLDRTAVLYTANCTLLEKFKDGRSSLNDPAAILFILRNTGGGWKIIYGAETYRVKNE